MALLLKAASLAVGVNDDDYDYELGHGPCAMTYLMALNKSFLQNTFQ